MLNLSFKTKAIKEVHESSRIPFLAFHPELTLHMKWIRIKNQPILRDHSLKLAGRLAQSLNKHKKLANFSNPTPQVLASISSHKVRAQSSSPSSIKNKLFKNSFNSYHKPMAQFSILTLQLWLESMKQNELPHWLPVFTVCFEMVSEHPWLW